jgi:hypothetical protein
MSVRAKSAVIVLGFMVSVMPSLAVAQGNAVSPVVVTKALQRAKAIGSRNPFRRGAASDDDRSNFKAIAAYAKASDKAGGGNHVVVFEGNAGLVIGKHASGHFYGHRESLSMKSVEGHSEMDLSNRLADLARAIREKKTVPTVAIY